MSPAAPATRRAGCPARSPASTRASGCSRSLRGASRTPASCAATRSTCRFPDRAFERVATMSFYGHLEGADRERFLAEARRVADELVIVDAALREDTEPEEWQERTLNDGSRWTVYKRYFTPEGLARRARRRRGRLRRPLVRLRPRVTRSRQRRTGRSPRSSATTARAEPASRPGSRWSRCRSSKGMPGSGRTCSARRPACRRAPSDARGAAAQARRSAAGSSWTRTSSTRRSTAPRSRAATRAERRPGRGDRTPTPEEQRLCALWRDHELRLLRPGARGRGRRARDPPAARRAQPGLRRPALRPRRRRRGAAPAPVGHEQMAERPRQSRATRAALAIVRRELVRL